MLLSNVFKKVYNCCKMDTQDNVDGNGVMASQRVIQWFIQTIRCAMIKHDLVDSDIDFINLTSNYWMSAEDFFSLTDIPDVYKGTTFGCREWSCSWELPSDFAIVFKNGSYLIYHDVMDPFYSGWCLVNNITKAPTQYVAK